MMRRGVLPAESWNASASRVRGPRLRIGVAVVGVAVVMGLVGGLRLVGASSTGDSSGNNSSSQAGVGAGVRSPPGGSSGSSGSGGSGGSEGAARDGLAARPMTQVPDQDRSPIPLTTRDPGPPILLPRAQRRGAAGVPTGFGHTPAGAMAQMIAIDQTAMQSGSLAGVRAVIGAWAAPGGPTAQTWSGVSAMASLLSGAGLSGNGSPALSVVVTPVMGLVKGSVGADFVVPCVDFEFDVTLTQTVRQAAADCERMVWIGQRWVIGPGAEPAPGTSVWPDTDLALSAGYRDLRIAPGTDTAAAGEVSGG